MTYLDNIRNNSINRVTDPGLILTGSDSSLYSDVGYFSTGSMNFSTPDPDPDKNRIRILLYFKVFPSK